MWMLTDQGFISVVQHDKDPELLQIRSRVKADLTNVLGDVEIIEIDGADYQFRCNVRREVVAEIVAQKVMTLDYTSHVKDVAIKRSAPAEGRSAAYYACWSAMAKMQPKRPYERTIPLPKKGKKGKGVGSGDWWNDHDRFEPPTPAGAIHRVPLSSELGIDAEDEIPEQTEPRICTVDHRDARKICEECGHAALLHPGLNDIDQCIVCELEHQWL